VENVATPDASAAVPITAPLSKNCTLPVAAEGVTVAVNVTACPTVEGFALEASATEEAACIFSASAAEVAPALDESPPYVAVIECVPLAKAEVENVATPDASVTLPIAAPLSKNCTVPVAAEGVTVAVNVTACPTVKGLALEASATEEAAFTF
jgi:hypothetical protein